MPKPDCRIPSRRERELFNQVRDLRERLDALSKDPVEPGEHDVEYRVGAALAIAYVDDAIAAIASLEEEGF